MQAKSSKNLRRLVLLATALVAPSLACDPPIYGTTRRAFQNEGLQIRSTTLVRYGDGTRTDRQKTAFVAERGERGAVLERESTQVVRRAGFKPFTRTSDEIVLFSGAAEAQSFLAARGIGTEEPTLLAPPPDDGDAPGFLQRRTLTLSDGTRGDPTPSGAGGLVLGGGDGGGLPGGPGDLSGGGGDSVPRYVMNDDLPLHATPSFDSAELMSLERGDRVFVLATPPVPAQGNVFVQVQVADRAPNPVGWMPLHWLVVSPRADAPVAIDFEASYGLVSKLVREQIGDFFYEGCDLNPRYAQEAIVNSTPELENPGSIPYAERYECGEIPFGSVESAARKHLTTFAFDTPGAHYEIANIPVIAIDSIHMEVPVKLYRLPWQERGTYPVRDMSTGWAQQFGDGDADVVEMSHYQKFDGELVDEMVRVHDSDVWFNVSWTPPAGLDPVPGAQAYFNLCWALPGVRVEGATTPLDVTMDSVGGAHSHVTGIYWGAVEIDPLRVCATAALRQTPAGPKGDDVFTTGDPTPPVQVQLVRASLRDVSVRFVEPIDLYGTFSGWHAPAISYLEDLLATAGENEGLLGFLFQAFFERGIEDRMSEQLHEFTTRLTRALPNPEEEIHDACNRLMPPSYRDPRSRWYPFYQHCIEATRHAEVTLFSNAVEHLQSCHDPGTMARANDGSAWTRRSDTHEVYYAPPDGDPVGIDRPYWVTQCEVEATVDTQVMSGYEEILDCASNALDEGLNFRRSMTWVRTQAQERCLTPTVGLLCELYGEGEDLIALWTEPLGVEPDLDGYTGFCDWYDSLTAPDLPDYTTDPD